LPFVGNGRGAYVLSTNFILRQSLQLGLVARFLIVQPFIAPTQADAAGDTAMGRKAQSLRAGGRPKRLSRQPPSSGAAHLLG
jgi:hypothetical protein